MNLLQNFYQSGIVENLGSYTKIITSALLGMLIGWDRSARNKPAGLKTFTFVAVSCTLITIISISSAEVFGDTSFNNRVDPMRLSAQIVSGLGFLGAGLIIKDGLRVKGLTSAAMVFFAGGVGIGIGAGFYEVVIFTVFVTLGIVRAPNFIQEIIDKRFRNKKS